MPGFLEYRLDIGKVSELPLTTLSIPAEHGRGRCLRGVHIVAHSTVLTLARSQYSTCEVLVLTLFCVLIRCQSCRAQHASASPSRLCASSSCARTSTRCAPCNLLPACNQPATSLQPACNQPATSLQPAVGAKVAALAIATIHALLAMVTRRATCRRWTTTACATRTWCAPWRAF